MKYLYLMASGICIASGLLKGDLQATTLGIVWLLMAKVQDIQDLLYKR